MALEKAEASADRERVARSFNDLAVVLDARGDFPLQERRMPDTMAESKLNPGFNSAAFPTQIGGLGGGAWSARLESC